MSTLYQNAHLMVRHYRASAYVCVVRSAAAFASMTEARAALTACRIALQPVEPSRHGILFDWRQAPISTDPALHKTLVEFMDGMAKPFVRRAILLATTVGAMQANRVGRKTGEQVLSVFGSEPAALEFVTNR
jgi:hypothetical protein